MVEVEDFMKAKPDAIALSAARIISLMKASGEKITQTFKSMCWRCKGIQVEEVAIIDVDSLGFDLRVCSGTQIQTMRVAFNSQVIPQEQIDIQTSILAELQKRVVKAKLLKKKRTHQNDH
uniref:DUF2470 domain-containing protein n=1 Tax=Salix viminalis TaxID=40686 RepID=A0A6N2M3V3_SALVM